MKLSGRAIGIIVIVFLLVILVCAGLAIAAAPTIEKTRVARATGTAIVKNTSTAEALFAAQTLTAVPTDTPTLTITPTSTSTLTPSLTPTPLPPTLVPTQSQCLASLTDSSLVYPVIGGGKMKGAVNLSAGTQVTIIGRLVDLGWYWVIYQASDGPQKGWIRAFKVTDLGGCEPTLYQLHYVFGIDPNNLVMEETFAENKYIWDNGSLILTGFNDRVLELASYASYGNVVIAHPVSPSSLNIGAFNLITSIRIGGGKMVGTDSYVGIRFNDTGDRYYELRVYEGEGACKLQVFKSNQFYQDWILAPGICTSTYGNIYLELHLDRNDILTVVFNDSDMPIRFDLQDQSSEYAPGNIALEVYHVAAQFDYLIVTKP